MTTNTIEFGDRVQDVITKFTGIVTGRATYITGCEQILVAPISDGMKRSEGAWFDVDRLTVVQTGAVTLPERAGAPGADAAAPIK